MPVGRSPPRAKNAEDFQKLMSEKFASPPIQEQQQQHNKRPRPADSPQPTAGSHNDASSMDMESKISEILLTVRQISSDFSALSVRVNDIEQAVEFNGAEIAQLRAENEKLRDENTDIKTRVSKIEENLENVSITVKREAVLRDENENNSRKINLEFSGVPKAEGETQEMPTKYVEEIMKLIGSENGLNAIDVAHRKMSGAIIARFKTRTQRDEVYDKRFALKGITSLDLGFRLPTKGNNIFINESLTFERSKVMADIRRKLKIVNEGRGKDNILRSKSAGGRLRIMKENREYVAVSSLEEFYKYHPSTREY